MQAIPSIKRKRDVPAAPTCTVSLRSALKKVFKAGYMTLTLDQLMLQLSKMRKLTAGLADRNVVVRALQWLSVHDENPLCDYDGHQIHGLM